MIAPVLCAFALLMDTASLCLLIARNALPVAAPVAFLIAHALAVLLFVAAFQHVLPERYEGTKVWTAIFTFIVAGFFPVLGIAGLLVLVVPALRHRDRPGKSKDIAHTPIVPLPPRPPPASGGGRSTSEGHLAGLLEHSTDARQRLAALTTTLSLKDGQAAPLLRLALKDHDDDVRLLAYALLDRKERAIESRIREQQAQLDQADEEARFAFHKALANDYWELARLNSGSAAEFLNRRACEHGHAALQIRDMDGGLQFLVGRIQLEQTRLDEAREAFERAEGCGVDARVTSSYLAEIAFRQLRFTEAAHHLSGGTTVTHLHLLDFLDTGDVAEVKQ